MLGTGTVSANGSEPGYRHGGGGALEAAGPMTAHSQPVQKSDGGTRRVQTEAGALALMTVRNPPVNADHFHTEQGRACVPPRHAPILHGMFRSARRGGSV